MTVLDRETETGEATIANSWVVAIVRPESLPRVREVLSSLPLLCVTVTRATSLFDRHELRYRGARVLAGKTVLRVEIACHERQVPWITRALAKTLDLCGAQGGPVEQVVAPLAVASVTA